ncbi:MAG: NAD-binding protein, partial [Hydrococcus sp. Prado102]|nr:NAD-binding protein [Hydrococcus sp. Prado102]
MTSETQYVILVLQNEPQCDAVCFGTTETEPSLISLLPKKSVVILCSTVTPTWATRASTTFQEHNIYFIDCPISGGPVRARDGELTLLSSADDYSMSILKETAKPVMETMGREWYVIEGGAGKGSMVKMVHQLLAGVHIVVAAEALALAAKAGLDVEQVYNIVNGAAGASWMFKDRGQRMITSEAEATEVKSQLQIFVKDLDIVYAEAKKLQSPIPLALSALQQFINAQGLGLSRNDDSSIKRVYEQVSGVPIVSSKSTKSSKIE